MSLFGNSVIRSEDPRLLVGAGQYVGDVKIAGAAHVTLVRSTSAHANLTSIDTRDAASMPGVRAIQNSRDGETEPAAREK